MSNKIIENKSGIYLKTPKYFNANITSVACVIKFINKILFLQKAPDSWSKNLWGIPCGIIEANEDLSSAIIRELKEEIRVQFQKDQLKYLGRLFIIQNDGIHNIHYVFYHKIIKKIDVVLSNEHSDYNWISKDEISSFDLIPNQNKVLSIFNVYDI